MILEDYKKSKINHNMADKFRYVDTDLLINKINEALLSLGICNDISDVHVQYIDDQKEHKLNKIDIYIRDLIDPSVMKNVCNYYTKEFKKSQYEYSSKLGFTSLYLYY